ncbi:MAG TPA: tetratricopeptide repeat protein, partial [Pirellulaceae bacterium]
AHALAQELKLPSEQSDQLRDVAISALSLPDIYPLRTWPGYPPGSAYVDFDDDLKIYVRTDQQGNCSIRRVDGDVELARIQGRGQTNGQTIPILSRDGRFVVLSQYPSRESAIWSLEQRQPKLLFSVTDTMNSVIHADGQNIAFSHVDGSISDFDISTGQMLHRLPPYGITREVEIAMHPTEPLVAVGSYFGQLVLVRDLHTGELVKSIPMPGNGGHIAWHPQGLWLAATDGENGSIHVFDRATFERQFVLGPTSPGARIYFDHAGDRLAVTGWMSGVQVFDFQTGHLQLEVPGAQVWAKSLRFSRDDRCLAGFADGTSLGLWQVPDGREFRALVRLSAPKNPAYGGRVGAVSDGRLLAVPMADAVCFWDLAYGRKIGLLPLEGPTWIHLEWDPVLEGEEAIGALLIDEVSGVFRWPIRRDSLIPGLLRIGPPQPLFLPQGAFDQSRDGRFRVTACRSVGNSETWAGVWVQDTQRPDALVHLLAGVDTAACAVSPDGKWLATTGHFAETTQLWELPLGKPVRELPGSRQLQFSADGRWLATGGPNGHLIDVRTWNLVRPIDGFLCLTPDGTQLIRNSNPSVLTLSDPATGRDLYRLESPQGFVDYHINVARDGQRIITVNYVQGIRVWDLPLLRRELAERGLDWKDPIRTPSGLAAHQQPDRMTDSWDSRQPLSIKFVPGDFESLRKTQHLTNLDRAVEAGPQIPVRWIARGEFLRDAGRWSDAESDFREAVRLVEPDDQPRLLAKFSDLLARLLATRPERGGDPQEAVTLAQRALKLRPGEWKYHNTLGIAYYRAGRIPEAIDELELSLANGGGEWDALDLYFLALCHQQRGASDQSRECMARATKWHQRHKKDLAPSTQAELARFREEADQALGSAMSQSLP